MTALRIAQAIDVATARLERAGINGARSDAQRLLAHVLGRARQQLRHVGDGAMTPEAAARFDAAIAAREAHQPVAQITGWRSFWAHEFLVTRDTLDPRPDTETLVAMALEWPWRRLLDLGTGTGAIVISLLAARPGTNGMGIDISPAALDVARGNACRIGVNADFVQSDWFAAVNGVFDLIVSNPPYIAADEMAGLDADVRDWEPHIALTDGGDGLGAYRRIVAGAGSHLAQGGRLMVEIGPTQAAAVGALMAQAGFDAVQTHHDLDGRDRVVSAIWGEFGAKSSG